MYVYIDIYVCIMHAYIRHMYIHVYYHTDIRRTEGSMLSAGTLRAKSGEQGVDEGGLAREFFRLLSVRPSRLACQSCALP